MSVKELIRELQKVDENKIVHVYTDWDYKIVDCVAEYEDIVEILPFYPKKEDIL